MSWAGKDYDRLFKEVYELYGNECVLCGREIDTSLPAGMPLSPEIDHRQAKALGGALKDISNLAPIHKWCNQFKGKKDLKVAKELYLATLWKTSRKWFSNSL